MRVVAGRLKGRVLKAPESRAIRPTSERLRESIFDILAHRHAGAVEGARVVDLFAGSGALAIEALSRGAGFALLVDNGSEARALLRGNVEALGSGRRHPHLARRRDQARQSAGGRSVRPRLSRSALWRRRSPVRRLASLVSGDWLKPGALVVVEEAAKAEIAAPPPLEPIDARVYGDTQIAIFAMPGGG